MMQIKKLFSILTIGVLALSLKAVPARRVPFEVTQPDGSKLTLQFVGDERFHCLTMADGTAVELDSATGFYKPMMADALAEKITLANSRRALVNERRLRRLNAARRVAATALATNDDEDNSIGQRTLYEGEKRGLVILVNFNDKKFVSTREEVDSMFNQTGYARNNHIGSVRDYFYDQSYGRFTINFDVVGPVELENNYAYYGENDSHGDDSRAHLMVAEALTAADDSVDFSLYDWGEDREVDQVFVLYAGYGENVGGADDNTVWPHEFELSTAYQMYDHINKAGLVLDGVLLDTYACSCELTGASGSRMAGIGTACHEFSHCLGFPDTYNTNYNITVPDMMDWDLMASGCYNGPNFNGEVPEGMTAYERWLCGWLEWNELTEEQNVVMSCLADEPQAYIWRNDNAPNEAYILENRQCYSWFTYPDKSHGLLIYHLDYDEEAFFSNYVNATIGHPRMHIIFANGTGGITSTAYRGHPWPGSTDNKSFTANTTPAASWYYTDTDGDTAPNMGLYDIGERGTYTSFKFRKLVADGISATTLANDTDSPHSGIWTLDGRRATTSDKDVVLMNGRKVIGHKN